jgi:SAM-dependent methyltransferase
VTGRDWRSVWRSVGRAPSGEVDDALRQVGKTVLGVPVPEEQLAIIVAAITANLDLGPDDHVIDLGCGNGVLTERIARIVTSVEGVDVSSNLIEDAKAYRNPPNVRDRVADLAHESVPGPTGAATAKWYAYEVLQHLAVDEADRLLARVADAAPAPARVFFGSIPDRDRLEAFYDTPERMGRYRRMVAAGNEQIGTWWVPSEIASLARARGFTCRMLPQDPSLYTAHYRFDALLTRGTDGGTAGV